jgi:hypothetical protein
MSSPDNTLQTALWGREAFLAELFRRFPVLEACQDPHVTGLLHCEMGWFSHKTNDAIKAGNFRLVRQHFEFVEHALAQASDELENAITVSYLENVFGLDTPNTRFARNLLTPSLSEPVLLMEGHFIAHVAEALPPISVDCDAQEAAELERRITAR